MPYINHETRVGGCNSKGMDIMANGMDHTMSRREFMIRRLGDLGIVAMVVAAGPIFGRMLNSLYVQDAARVREVTAPARATSPVHSDESKRVATAENADR